MTDESWPSSVDAGGPFVAERHESGWWIVVNARGEELDDSGDGGLTEKSAHFIADALNDAAPLRTRIAELEGALKACAEAPHSGWTIAQALARATLNGEKMDG